MNEDKNWEKRFDRDWTYLNGELPKHFGRTEEIKSFISNLLSTQRQEVIERLEDFGEILGTRHTSTSFKELLADLREGNV